MIAQPGARTLLLALSLAAACGSDPAPQCTLADDCPSGQACVSGSCQESDAGVHNALGGTCSSSGECLAALSCELDGTGLTGGLCTQACAASSCPAGAGCADLRATPVNEKICLATCSKDADCRSGWGCCASLGSLCLPAALCPQAASGAAADLGAACAAGSCAAGEACRFGAGFPGGACVKTCAIGQAGTCPGNGRCVDTAQGPLCLPACASGADCRAGYTCAAPAAGGDKVCQGTGDTGRTCTAGATPVLLAGGLSGPASAPASCIKPIARTSLPAAQVRKLGRHQVGERVTFDVPSGAGSLSVVSQAVAARSEVYVSGSKLPNVVVPTDLRLPSGQLLYDDSAQPPADLSTAPVYYAAQAAPLTGSLTLPNTTAGVQLASGGLPGGTWSLTVNDYARECLGTSNCDGGSASGSYDVSVLVRPAATPSSGTIDVAFYLVGASGLTAATAVGDAHVKRMISTLSGYLGQAGLCLGSATFYDVPAWAQGRYATGIHAEDESPCSNLSQMFTLARAGNTLNFFLVGTITGGTGGEVVGIDGTIPGPSTVGGTIHSGAAVNASDLPRGTCGGAVSLNDCGADRVAYIAAHEAGHWLGLYHTSEATGDLFDPLADTATCDCKSCVGSTRAAKCGANDSSATLVGASDCSTGTCGGADNLMFWLLSAGLSKGKLTAQQAQVARANLLAQ